MTANPSYPRVARRAAAILLATAATASVGCNDDAPTSVPPPVGPARAFGLWTPGPTDTCTKEQHDVYVVTGPDGKQYPTWHPPNDPVTGCRFGHEHGRDPRGSRLYRSVGAIPFGYANEQLEIWDPQNPRNEDHFGHKVEWENDVHMRVPGIASGLLDVRCDVLVKLHQGTHSKDAFTNNLHELVYHIRCNEGTEMHVTMMAAIGTPGEFSRTCNGEESVHVGPATPANSPNGGGRRIIPDRECILQELLRGGNHSGFGVLHESWQTSNQVRREDGHTVASFDPYFQVFLPSRYYDPTVPGIVGRPIDLCYPSPNGQATGGPCEEATSNGTIAGITWNDARSPFNGVHRVVDINGNRIDNEGGPSVWYTDPFGRHGKTTPFAGSIRQVLAKINNALEPSGPGIGHERFYGGPGVRAPN